MLVDNKKKLPELNEEELADKELEDVSGGHIEIAEDEATASAEKKIVTNGLTSNGRGHWA
ncbi:MAG: hypothetical protein ABFD25_15100 [Clostridiaceae bacterium]